MTEVHQTSEPTESQAPPAGEDVGPSPPDRARARRRGGMLLYVALLVAGVLAAWQAHEFLRSRAAPAAWEPPSSGAGASPGPVAPGRLDPRALRNPLAGQGLRPLRRDPGLLPAPKGATLQPGSMHRTRREIEQYLFRYIYRGTPADVRAHYDRVMRARHLPPAKSAKPNVLVYGRGNESVVVRYAPAGGREGVLVLRVTWTQMGRPAAPQGVKR